MIAIAAIIGELLFLATLKAIGISIDDITASFLILFFSIAFLTAIQKNKILQRYKLQLMLGYLLRISLLYFDLYGNSIFVLPNSGADADVFYYGAVRYMNYGGFTRTIFPLVMGTLFRVIGENRLYAQFLVMLFSMISLCLLVYSLNELSISTETGIKVIGITALLPNLAILSSIFLRESMVAMFVSFSIYFFVLWYCRKYERYFIIALLFVLPAAVFHSGTAGMLPGYLAIRLLFDKNTGRIRVRFTNVIAAAILAVSMGYLFINYSDILLSKLGNVDSLEDIANVSDRAGSSYAQYVGNSSSIQNLLIYTFPRIVYFLYSPFPWQWRGVNDLIAFFFSSLFYMVATWSMLRCLTDRNSKQRTVVAMFAILIGMIVFIFGWGVSNAGTAARHREKLAILFAIMWALSSEGRTAWLHIQAGNTRII